MENSAKIFYQYCNNASNDMFSKATTKIIEANRAIFRSHGSGSMNM